MTINPMDAPFFAVFDGVTDDGQAIQSAIDTGEDIEFPPLSAFIGNAVLKPKSNQRIYGFKGKSVIKKTTTGPTNFIQPFFDILDVENVTIEGLTLDFDKGERQELGFHVRSTTQGATNNIFILSNILEACWIWVEGQCENVTIKGNKIDGQNVAYAGIATGGKFVNGLHDPSNNEALYGAGPVRWLTIEGNFIRDVRTEGVDINWSTQDAIVKNNFFLDVDSGGGQTAIDVGSNDSDNTQVSSRVLIDGNLIYFSKPIQNSGGIEIKRDINYATVVNNIILNGDTTSPTGIILTNPQDAIVSNNHVVGFKYGCVYNGDAGVTNCTISGNSFRAPGYTGILVTDARDVTVCNNRIYGSFSTAYGIDHVSNNGTTNFCSINGNRIRGQISHVGIYVRSSCSDIIINDNDVYGLAGTAIHSDAPRTTINDNQVANCANAGIGVAGMNSTASGNRSINNLYGINIYAGADFITLIGNQCMDTRSGVSKTQLIGFYFLASVAGAICVGNRSSNHKTANTSGSSLLSSPQISANIW